MCGIFAYIGQETDAAQMTHAALCDLEYRGYDSWGIAVDTGVDLYLKKEVGKISAVPLSDMRGVRGCRALGHSRWATHGGVTRANAHPHVNRDGTIAVVHNGIIENHAALKEFVAGGLGLPPEELFRSETDTEVIPHLIDYFMTREGKSFEDAFVATAKKIEGRFAFVALRKGTPTILAVRDGSPLILGKGGDAFYLASDIPALLEHTRMIRALDDREFARIASNDVFIRDLDTKTKADASFARVSWEKEEVTKGGYVHFMQKEIMEQADTIDAAIRQNDGDLLQIARLMKTYRTFPVGCGTAAKMARLGEIYFARIGGILTQSIVGSEWESYASLIGKNALLFAVSQSGETADVLEALRGAHKSGAKIVSLLNVVGSSMERMSDKTLYINAGPEVAVASTKAATAQIAVLYLIAHALKGTLGEGKHRLRKLVRDLRAWLGPDLSAEVKNVAQCVVKESDIYVIGRGLYAPIAQEAAIKIQEVSYIHADGFPGGELKHGPIALVREGTPCIVLMPDDDSRVETESNAMELKARGAQIIGIAPDPNPLFDDWIKIPHAADAGPIAALIPIQLLAYHLAVLRGNDPDKPRNLAKSVTVK